MSAGQGEVLAIERRRWWSEEAKAAIVAEASQAGASVSWVARRHGLHPNQVFTRRRELRERGSAVSFAEVRVRSTMPHAGVGMMEIELAGGGRVRVDRDVDATALARVVAVLEGRR